MMARAGIGPLLATVVLLEAPCAWGQQPGGTRGWSVTFLVGAPLNLPARVTIRQAGSPDLRFAPRWETRPFEPPLYWSVRVGRWDGRGAWEVELLHHKLYLVNPSPEVQRFDISHGFNLLLVSRTIAANGVAIRAGPGLVVAHPENTVRGRPLPPSHTLLGGGYHLAGPALALAVGREWDGPGPVRLAAEAKVTGAWARVPVAGGRATVPSIAVHALAGIGFARQRPGRRRRSQGCTPACLPGRHDAISCRAVRRGRVMSSRAQTRG